MAINRHAHTYVRAYAPRPRRLFETRRLLALQPNLPPACKRGRRLFKGGVYSRKYGKSDATQHELTKLLSAEYLLEDKLKLAKSFNENNLAHKFYF